ncbi:VOC family protein [Desulfospira joergensenii]|uniref:VOC family protein n=1 Tax=Desulfospira joergensenii TaxID=53329 RepID=UPI0003B5FA5C|nr:VOC family protein [Desulfospira joergensenii]
MQTKIDHLVIGAATLTQGVNYVRDHLGVDMPYGGVHTKMGTHNHLMRIGNDAFLEIIAINHDIAPPNRPRWFGLDDPFIRQQIKIQPSLLTWVVNTRNIKNLMRQSAFSFGKAELISRGNLSWYFGLPDDGRLLAGGMLPYAIEWQTDKHPSVNMADLGCSFYSLEIYHSYPRWLQSALSSVGASDLVKVNTLPKNEVPYMIAYINAPNGIKKLYSSVTFNKANSADAKSRTADQHRINFKRIQNRYFLRK